MRNPPVSPGPLSDAHAIRRRAASTHGVASRSDVWVTSYGRCCRNCVYLHGQGGQETECVGVLRCNNRSIDSGVAMRHRIARLAFSALKL